MLFSLPIRPVRGRARAGAGAGPAAAALAVALLLGGCTGSPGASASPSPTSTEKAAPIFESDEEALAAAEAALGDYLRVLNEIASSGNQDPSRIRAVATERYAAEVENVFDDLTQNGLRIEGTTRIDSMTLVEHFEENNVAHVVVLYCSDVSQTRVIDSAGSDVTPATRPPRSAMQAELVSVEPNQPKLLPEDEDPWSGEYC